MREVFGMIPTSAFSKGPLNIYPGGGGESSSDIYGKKSHSVFFTEAMSSFALVSPSPPSDSQQMIVVFYVWWPILVVLLFQFILMMYLYRELREIRFHVTDVEKQVKLSGGVVCAAMSRIHSDSCVTP